MTGFAFPRFTDRRNLDAPAPGATTDAFGGDSDLGEHDSAALGTDDPVVTAVQFRVAPGGIGRVFLVES